MNVPDVKAQRKKWIENINNYDKEKLVFLDESGVNTDMTRIYGRSKKGTRSVDKTPLNTPANTTILSSVRLNGETCYTTYSGGTTGKKFVDYLENMLIPTLKEGDIIVMDKGKIIIKGSKEDVLREEKIFNKIGLDLPFIVELSIKLNYYGLLDKICFSNSELVQSIWK